MTIEEIIYKKYVEEIINNIGVPSTYRYDLAQEVYMILLQYDNTRLQEIPEKEIKYFISKIILNQWNSRTSPFYKLFKKYRSHWDDNYKWEEDNEDNTTE